MASNTRVLTGFGHNNAAETSLRILFVNGGIIKGYSTDDNHYAFNFYFLFSFLSAIQMTVVTKVTTGGNNSNNDYTNGVATVSIDAGGNGVTTLQRWEGHGTTVGGIDGGGNARALAVMMVMTVA